MEQKAFLEMSVSELKGVGEVRRKSLAKLGIETVSDLLRHYPRAYQNRADVKSLAEIGDMLESSDSFIGSVVLTVASQPTARMVRRGMNILRFRAFDSAGTVEITYFNQNYLKEVFTVGSTFRFWGKVYREARVLKMKSPIYEPYVEGIPLPSLVPVYPLASGISQKFLSGIIKDAAEKALFEMEDVFSDDMREKYGLMSIKDAIYNIHFPKSLDDIGAARRRLSFEEAFVVSAAFASEQYRTSSKAPAMKNLDISEYLDSLPYALTKAQKRSLDEICADLSRTEPMRRILIGDVGSGKTAVAAGAAYAAVKNGYQCAIMVPTEILASQHYAELKPLFAKLGINVELLTGSTSSAEKRRILSVLAGEKEDLTGRIDVVVGTHAIISENVVYSNLGLVITDEQHRFGVMQRASLANKSDGVHVLVMSATPIPRTLSLVYYGDLDLSRLDEMPPGRQRVETFVVDERYRERINRFIRTHAKVGNKTYIVCPMVEEGQSRTAKAYANKMENDSEEMADYIMYDREEDRTPMKATVEFARELALRLPDLNIGLVYGKMKASQKDAVMKEFSDGALDVLVSTTVVEVGVNVPEATLMIIENAERFGLSQLHQLRGRVGRSDRKSFCILVSDSKSEKARERLAVMKNTYDGYEIAEADLKLRGAGDFFSADGRYRQHGDSSSFLFGESSDHALVDDAVKAAYELLLDDPSLEKEENRALKKRIDAMKKNVKNTIS